jgi:Thioredoxin like C-terminal domain
MSMKHEKRFAPIPRRSDACDELRSRGDAPVRSETSEYRVVVGFARTTTGQLDATRVASDRRRVLRGRHRRRQGAARAASGVRLPRDPHGPALSAPDHHRAVATVVCSPGGRPPIRSACSSTATLRASHGVDVDVDGNGLLREGRLYQLVREHDAVRERTLEIMFLEPGAEAYSCTFE